MARSSWRSLASGRQNAMWFASHKSNGRLDCYQRVLTALQILHLAKCIICCKPVNVLMSPPISQCKGSLRCPLARHQHRIKSTG